MIGKTLGHYQVIEKPGESGMGVVYIAHDLHLDRFVAANAQPPESQPAPAWPLEGVRSGQ
jgi:hypothetical protein